jgi:hypothetical protein
MTPEQFLSLKLHDRIVFDDGVLPPRTGTVDGWFFDAFGHSCLKVFFDDREFRDSIYPEDPRWVPMLTRC